MHFIAIFGNYVFIAPTVTNGIAGETSVVIFQYYNEHGMKNK